MEDGVAGHPLFVRGGSVLVMERIQRRSCPDWSVWMVGWHSKFFYVVLGGMAEKLMGGRAELVRWGADGVQQYVSPGTGLR